MKRKAANSIQITEADACNATESKKRSEDVEIRHDAEKGTWHITMSQAAEVCGKGCFHLTVTSGTLQVRGSNLTSADGPQPVASYSSNSCFKLQVQARSEGVPLVLARVAACSFTLAGSAADCGVWEAGGQPAGVQQEPDESSEAWEQAIEDVVESAAKPPKILICGPKKTGKSSLARRLVNVLLAHHDSVNLLEADCGQPQFGPPGFVSLTRVAEPLLLPPHCMLRQPDEMMCIGDVSAESNPVTYVNTIRKLLAAHYGADASGAQGGQPPLVVNTMGWVKGFGMSLLRDIMHAVCPTHILSLCSGNPRKDVATSAPWMQAVAEQHSIRCIGLPCISAADTTGAVATGAHLQKPQAHSAADDRNSRLHAWMLATLQVRQPREHSWDTLLATAFSGRLVDTATQLCACPPVVLPLGNVQVVPMFEGWSPPNTTAVLNGALVALVAEGELPQGATEAHSLQEHIVSNPPRCCGLGLIHAVASASDHGGGSCAGSAGAGGVAYVHTPVSLESMQTVTALVVGMLEAPAAVMRAAGLCSPYVALRCLASDVGGGGVMRSRRSLPRLGQALND